MVINGEMFYKLKGFEDRYLISKSGKVYSIKSKMIMKPNIGRGGYYSVSLTDNNHKLHHLYLHQLLAKQFIPNPNNCPVINHKDENKLNNDLSNLEWCDYTYNNTYNNIHKKRGEKISETIKKRGGQHNKGKKMSEKQKRKLSTAKKGKPFMGNQYIKAS